MTSAGVVEAAVTGVRVVKGFGQEERELGGSRAPPGSSSRSRLRAVRLTARYNPALQAVPAIGQVGVLLFGGWLAASGKITLGTFLAFSTYVGQLVGPVRMLAALLTVGQQARASVERVFEVIDSTPKVVDAPDAVELPAGPGAGSSSADVTFGYTASHPVLRGLELTVEPGETLALVGGAGSGKSTISLLLPRFYDVQSGAVRVDGVDVRDTTMDFAASADRGRLRRELPVQRLRCGQHRVRPSRRDRSADPSSRPRCRGRRFHPRAAERLRDRGRRARPDAVGRAASAGRIRPGAAVGPADPAAR